MSLGDARVDSYDLVVLISRYLPGFKHGGPITSVSNLVATVGCDYRIAIVCFDRDTGMSSSYPQVSIAVPHRVGKADVYYLRPGWGIAVSLIQLLKKLRPRVVYSNSLFEHRFSMLPALFWRLGLLSASGFIVAPRGELADNALKKGSAKKKLMLFCMRAIRLYRNAAVQATSDDEVEQFGRAGIFNPGQTVKVPNFVAADRSITILPKSELGTLRIVFFARISQMKNLVFALELLKEVDPKAVSLDIWGPIEDEAYFEKCKRALKHLPPEMKVEFLGPLEPAQQVKVLPKYDLLLLPTLTENHGHAILESMAAGLPVLISTGTPWRNLAVHKAGLDVPLSDPQAWRDAITKFVEMDSATKESWAHGAQRYARETAKTINQPHLFAMLYDRAIEVGEYQSSGQSR